MNAAHELCYAALGSWISLASIIGLARCWCPDAGGRARALIWAFAIAWLFALLPVIHALAGLPSAFGGWVRASALGLWAAPDAWSLGPSEQLGPLAQMFGTLAGLSVVLGAIRLTASICASIRLVQGAQVGSDALQRLVKTYASQWDLHPPQVRVSPQTQVPLLIGWRRPTIVLPPLLAQADDPRVSLALLHELAHLRRGDLVQHHVLAWLQVPFLLHPCSAWAAGEIVLARELAVDAMVAPRAPHVYATLLLDLAGQVCAKVVHGVALHPSGLSRRIDAICHPQAECPRRLWFVGAWASTLWVGAWMAHPSAANPAAKPTTVEHELVSDHPDAGGFVDETDASLVMPNACVEGVTALCGIDAQESRPSPDDTSTSSDASQTLLCPAQGGSQAGENTSA